MAGELPAESIRRTIGYYYLVAYCPAGQIGALREAAEPLRRELAGQAGLGMGDYFPLVIPEVCQRIVAFHQGTRGPDGALVQALVEVTKEADSSAEGAAAFQAQMTKIAALPQRARSEKRLHRRRGCMLCAAPCGYGYFSLISEPRFDVLQQALQQAPERGRSQIFALWEFTVGHVDGMLGGGHGHTAPEHLANLAYCLLSLATAKSRYPFPEAPMRALQQANQELAAQWQARIDRGMLQTI